MGLLDSFFGNADQTRALGLLGAQMMAGKTPQGLLMANEYLAGAPERQMKKTLMEAQIAETMAQADERRVRREQAERQERWMNTLLPGIGPSAPAGAAPAGSGGAGGILGLSQQLGIPVEAIQADIAFNGGKKISELLAERSKPNWQNVNGNLVNTNATGFKGGFQPGFSVSSDGKAVAWQPTEQGLVFGAPPGALPTYGAYRQVEESTKADFDPQTVTPAGQPPQLTTRGALVRNPQVQNRVPPAVQIERDAERKAVLQAELEKARLQHQNALRVGDQSAAARAQGDIASLERELGGRAPTVGMPLQSEEEKLRSTKGVEGDAKTNEARAKDVKTARDFLRIASQAEQALQSSPTQSGVGSIIDKGAAFFGQSTPGSVVAQRLKALGGWLVANVPRMEGPQSNFDVGNYQTMAADVANETLPVERRLAALREIQQMMGNVVNGTAAPPTQPQGQEAPRLLSDLPKNATKGMRVRDTQTGEILQFNGASWQKVK